MSLVVVDPTYRGTEHAPINAAFTQLLTPGASCIATTPAMFRAMVAIDPSAPLPAHEVIDVLPSGGVTLRRMRVQWRVLSALVVQHKATALLLLSAGPETLFVARALTTRHPGLRIHAIMHNMSDMAGWRSRDPRRRWIDMRAGLRWADHPAITLVVLEDYIAAAARDGGSDWRGIWRGVANRMQVWPHPTLAQEQPKLAPWTPGARLRLTIAGRASRDKGFDTILALAAASPQHDWSVTGRLDPPYDAAPPMPSAAERLSRPDYLTALRRADYAVVAHQPAYDLTASGSILDCATNRIPVIALRSPAVTALSAHYGPLGPIVPDAEAALALLDSPALRDTAAYSAYQRSLEALHQSRTIAALAPLIRGDLGLAR